MKRLAASQHGGIDARAVREVLAQLAAPPPPAAAARRAPAAPATGAPATSAAAAPPAPPASSVGHHLPSFLASARFMSKAADSMLGVLTLALTSW